MDSSLELKDGSFTIFPSSKTNYTWTLGLLINIQSERKFLFKRKILMSSHFTKCKSGEMSHGDRNGDTEPRPGFEYLPPPPWTSVSNFCLLNSFSLLPRSASQETFWELYVWILNGWEGGTSLPSFKQTLLWCQSFLIPPYSIFVGGEPSGLFF